MTADQDDELLRAVGGPSAEALERMIYVVGSARGGTSISFRIIELHDNVISLGGPSHFLNHVWRYRNTLHDRLWRQLLWTSKYIRRKAVRDSLPEDRRDAYLLLINQRTEAKRLAALYQLYPITRALDPEETRNPTSLVAWVDKGNDFWGVDRLARAFPQGRFVQVVRDPRAAIASLSKRVADQRGDTKFRVEPRDVIAAALYWRNLVRQQLRFARRHPSRTILFRFEDLTERPVEVVRALYYALGLPPVADGELKARIDGLEYGASLNATERGTGISTAPNVRWMHSLDAAALGIIAEICGPSARRLGYDLPPSADQRGWIGIVALVPGLRAKAITLAKLTFLTVMDRACGVQLLGTRAISAQ